MKLTDLGWCVVQLTITPASCSESGIHTPEQSVTLYGEDGLKALRDALNEAFPPEDSQH